MNAPNIEDLVVTQKYFKLGFVKMLRQLLPNGRGWEIPIEEELEIRLVGILSSESFGGLTITVGNVNVVPTGIASAEAFGLPNTDKQFISATGIVTLEGFGQPAVTNP